MTSATSNLTQAETRRPKLTIDFNPTRSRKPPKRIPELHGLRGLAIAMVVFFHYISFAIQTRPQGLMGFLFSRSRLLWCGVDLFFVLSGFLIGGILLDSRDSPNYFKTFYIRRFCRIVPIYLLFAACVVLAYWLIYRPVGARLDWAFAGTLPWYSYISFAQNMWMAKFLAPGMKVMDITWSLAVEEQFYLLLPAIIRFVRRSALPRVFLTGIFIAPILRIYFYMHFPKHFTAPYLLLPCRMDSFFVGALCAYWSRDPETWKKLVARRIWIQITLLVLVLGALVMNESPFAPFTEWLGFDWIAVLFAAAMMLALTNTEGVIGRALRWKWLRGLGTIAYGTYLFHMLVYCLCMGLIAGHGYWLASWKDLGVTVLSLGITLALAKLSWRYFEGPIVRRGHIWQY